MSRYTDKDIPISCGECKNWVEEGLRSMMIHILKAHPEYEPGIVYEYAQKWMQVAYEANDEWEMKQTLAYRRSHAS